MQRSSDFELDGLIEDHQVLSKVASANESMIELQLQKCLLMAYQLKYKVPSESIVIDGCQLVADQRTFKEQLRTLAGQGNLFTSKAKTLMDKLIKEDYSGSGEGPYEVLRSLKRQLKVIDVRELHRLIGKADKAGEKIKGEKSGLLMFIGDTGCGKTTTIKALLGYRMSRQSYGNMSTIDVDEEVQDPVVRQMRCDPSCKSVTRYVVVAKPKEGVTYEDILLVDTPGFNDTAGVEVELANMIGTKRALKKARSIRIVIVIGKDSWGTRYNGIRQMARTISMLFEDYSKCKDSVTIMFNNQTHEDVKQKAGFFKQILQESAPSDKNDENFVSFINHLHEVTAELDEDNIPKYLIYDPLSNKPKEAMERLLSKKPIKNPSSVFSDRASSKPVIKNFCSEIGRRADYYLEKGNFRVVEYFFEQLEQLQACTSSEQCKNEYDRIMEEIKNRISFDYINEKVAMLEVTKEDVDRYDEEINKISECNRFMREKDYRKEAQINMVGQMERLIDQLRKQLEGGEQENSTNIQKIALTIYILTTSLPKKFQPAKNPLQDLLQQRQEDLKKKYERGLETAQGVLNIYSLISQIQTVFVVRASLMGEVDKKCKEFVNKKLGPFKLMLKKPITQREEQAYNLLEIVCSENIEKLIQIDRYFQVLVDNHQFLKELSSNIKDRVCNIQKQLKDKIIGKCDELVNEINILINEMTHRPLQESDTTRLKRLYTNLYLFGRIQCVSQRIHYEKKTIEDSAIQKVREQSRRLHTFNSNSKKTSSDLLADIKSLDQFLNIFTRLVETFSEETRQKGIKLEKEILESELPAMIQKIFKGKNQEELSEERFQKIKDAQELEQFFSRNERRYQEDRRIMAYINKESRQKLLQEFESYFKSLQAVEDINLHFANTAAESFKATINFQKIEKLLKMISILQDACNIPSLKDIANRVTQVQTKTERTLMQFRQSIERSVQLFRLSFMDPKMDEVEQRCSTACSNLGKKLKQLEELERLPYIRKLVLHDDNELRNQLEQDLQEFVDVFKVKFGKPATVEEAIHLQAKCSSIIKLSHSNSKPIEYVIGELSKLQKIAEVRIERDMERNQKRLHHYFKARQYVELKSTIISIKKHEPNSPCFDTFVLELVALVTTLKKQLKRQLASYQEVNTERMLERVQDLLGLRQIREQIEFNLPLDLLTEQRKAMLLQLQNIKAQSQLLKEDAIPEGFTEALVALDRLTLIRNALDQQQIINFLEIQPPEKEVKELGQKLANCRLIMEENIRNGLNNDQFIKYTSLFSQQPNLFNPKFTSMFEEMGKLWKVSCVKDLKMTISNIEQLQGYRQRKEALKLMRLRYRLCPKEMEVDQRSAELEATTDDNYKNMTARLRGSLGKITQLSLGIFREYFEFLSTEPDYELECQVSETIDRIFQKSTSLLTAKQFIIVYRDEIREFIESGAREYPNILSSNWVHLQRKSKHILNKRMEEIVENFGKDCLQVSQNFEESKKNGEAAGSLIRNLRMIKECVQMICGQEHPTLKDMASIAEKNLKEMLKFVESLLTQFQKAVKRCNSIDAFFVKNLKLLSERFTNINQMKKMLDTVSIELRFLETLKDETVSRDVRNIRNRFETVFKKQEQETKKCCKPHEKAVEELESIRFEKQYLQGLSAKQIHDNLKKYKQKVKFAEQTAQFYAIISKRINYDPERVHFEAESMAKDCWKSLFELEGTQISSFSFRTVVQSLCYLRVYESVFQRLRQVAKLEDKINEIIGKLARRYEGLSAKTTEQELKRYAYDLVKLKVIEIEADFVSQRCKEVIEKKLQAIPKQLVKWLATFIEKSENVYNIALIETSDRLKLERTIRPKFNYIMEKLKSNRQLRDLKFNVVLFQSFCLPYYRYNLTKADQIDFKQEFLALFKEFCYLPTQTPQNVIVMLLGKIEEAGIKGAYESSYYKEIPTYLYQLLNYMYGRKCKEHRQVLGRTHLEMHGIIVDLPAFFNVYRDKQSQEYVNQQIVEKIKEFQHLGQAIDDQRQLSM